MARRMLAAVVLGTWLCVGACSGKNETITLGERAGEEECIPPDASCDRSGSCCVGVCDDRDHVCRSDEDCVANGDECDSDRECCSEQCASETCVAEAGAPG